MFRVDVSRLSMCSNTLKVHETDEGSGHGQCRCVCVNAWKGFGHGYLVRLSPPSSDEF